MASDFRNFTTVALDPKETAQDDPHWEILNDGAEIFQKFNSDPGLAVGRHKLEGVDFEGTFFIAPDPNDVVPDDDFVGFVFGYVSERKFYVVSWKAKYQRYWREPRPVAKAGITLKLVNSTSGPGPKLRNALWNDASVEGETVKLWQSKQLAWNFDTAYRWKLVHRPAIGLIRFELFKGLEKVADSRNRYDHHIKGGQLGVYCFSQAMIKWSNLVYRCNGKLFKCLVIIIGINLLRNHYRNESSQPLNALRWSRRPTNESKTHQSPIWRRLSKNKFRVPRQFEQQRQIRIPN